MKSQIEKNRLPVFWKEIDALSKKIAKAGSISGLYIGLLSDESYFIERAPSFIRDYFIDNPPPFSLISLSYDELVKKSQDGFFAASLFEEETLIIVTQADKAFQKKAEWFACKHLLSSVGLVFFASVTAGRKNQYLATAGDYGVSCSFVPKLKGYEFPRYIESLENHLCLTLDEQARRMMAILYQDQYSECESILRHLKLAFPEKRVFSSPEVIKVTGPGFLSAFQVSEYLTSGRSGMALAFMEQLIESGESPLAFLGLMTRLLHDLRLAQGESSDGSRQLNPYIKRKLSQMKQGLTIEEIDSTLMLCDQADTLLKSSKVDPSLLFGEVVLSLSKPTLGQNI